MISVPPLSNGAAHSNFTEVVGSSTGRVFEAEIVGSPGPDAAKITRGWDFYDSPIIFRAVTLKIYFLLASMFVP